MIATGLLLAGGGSSWLVGASGIAVLLARIAAIRIGPESSRTRLG
jgi:hypothetical protein